MACFYSTPRKAAMSIALPVSRTGDHRHARLTDRWLSTWDCCPFSPRQVDWGEGTGRCSPAPQADSRWGWVLVPAPHSLLHPIRRGLSGVTQLTGQLPTHPGTADEDAE